MILGQKTREEVTARLAVAMGARWLRKQP